MVYKIERVQRLPITIEHAWDFFSSPKNLEEITPTDMTFELTSGNGDENIHAGQILTYKVAPIGGIKLFWMTEITHVVHHSYFVDEQRRGPYTLWHHKHTFVEIPGGVEMSDVVWYELPFGFIGRIAHALFVKKKVQAIFDYRFKLLGDKFGSL